MALGKEEAEDMEIVKARNDKREYKRIVLPNALQVLLISDSDTDKAISVPHYFFKIQFDLGALITDLGQF